MINIILFGAIAAVVGIGLGILFNILVIKNFPETGRKMSYVKTVIVFLLISVVLFAAIYGKTIVDSYVKKSSNDLEQYMITNYSKLDFVKNGLDITAIKNDVSKINTTVNDLSIILKPKADELGVPNLIYNMGMNTVAKELQKKLVNINTTTTEKADNPFVNEKNFLTVSSLMFGMQTVILKIVKITVIVIVFICVVLLGIYILVSLTTASREKKHNAGN